MNLTLRFNTYDFRRTSWEWEEALESIRAGESDFTFGAFLARPQRFRNFGQTSSFFRESIEWFVGGDWTIAESEWPYGVLTYNAVIFLVFVISVRHPANATESA